MAPRRDILSGRGSRRLPGGTFESLAEYIDLFPLVVGFNSLLRSFFRRPRSPSLLPRHTAVIPFYAEATGALHTVASLSAVTPAPDAIILVDDGSATDIPADALPKTHA